jgi:hypothetical protein
MSFRLFTDPENEKGATWFPFTLRGDNERHQVEFLIRKVPAAKDDELTFRHYGRKMTMRFKRGEQLVERDPDKLLAYAIDKASFALLEARGDLPPLEAGDDGAAAQLSEVLGRIVSVGEPVPLVGCWTPGVKRLVFSNRRDILAFVNRKADELGGAEGEEESELGKT